VGGVGCCAALTQAVFDVGCLPARAVGIERVFVTSGAQERIGALVQHAARRRELGLKSASYFVPAHCTAPMRAVLAAAATMNGGVALCAPECVVALAAGERVALSADCSVVSWATKGPVGGGSQGYSVLRRRKKLLPELAARLARGEVSGKDVGDMAAAGEEIQREVENCAICWAGDTAFSAVLGNQQALEAECLCLCVPAHPGVNA